MQATYQVYLPKGRQHQEVGTLRDLLMIKMWWISWTVPRLWRWWSLILVWNHWIPGNHQPQCPGSWRNLHLNRSLYEDKKEAIMKDFPKPMDSELSQMYGVIQYGEI